VSPEKKSKNELEFRYRQVEPNAYGLSTDEILKLDDRQLNKWVSMKKVTGYKSRREEQTDKIVYDRKGKDEQHKRKMLASV
jgi:protein KRI1